MWFFNCLLERHHAVSSSLIHLPAERVELLIPLSEIENLSDDCEEIQFSGLLKRYIERPECMQNITLADWAAWYDSCGKKGYRKTNKKWDVDNLLLTMSCLMIIQVFLLEIKN